MRTAHTMYVMRGCGFLFSDGLSLLDAACSVTGAAHRPGVHLAPPPGIALWLGDPGVARLGRERASF
jgi:hypothetical protein